MNILWVTNLLLPEATAFLQRQKEIRGSGGWMQGLADALHDYSDNVQLSVAALSPLVKELTEVKGKYITYYVIPSVGDNTYHNCYEEAYKEVCKRVKPQVVHIHGTEFPHSLAFVNGCGNKNVCVSIQGLVSVCQNYYSFGLSLWELISSITPAGLLRNGILQGYLSFHRRARYEKELIRKVKHIIGRTSWDKAHVWVINPEAEYYHGGEILRKEFYEGDIWQYSECIPHSIFISQGEYPLKGVHQVLRAMPMILHYYPDAIVRIAGQDVTRGNSWAELLKLSDYGYIVRKIIRKNKLKDSVTFTGPLGTNEMKLEYLRSNVFVCPSSIENSPNSLGEAQILGTPCVASYVGGVMDMMRGNKEHLYRFEEVEMLAYKICQIFESQDSIDTNVIRQEAIYRHDPNKNALDTLNIYRSIINS